MERRKFIAGLGSLTAAGAAGISTGAFSSMEASRDVEINVTGDGSGYLQLRGTAQSNGRFVETTEDGEMYLDFGDSGNSGSGVNVNSTTEFEKVITTRNRGTEDVWLYVEDDLGSVDFYWGNRAGQSSAEGPSNAVKVPVGGGPTKLSIRIRSGTEDIDGTVTFYAETSDPSGGT
jgi:hypothetical protein